MEKTYRRAVTDLEKDEILTRLRKAWEANPALRLGQLIGTCTGVMPACIMLKTMPDRQARGGLRLVVRV